MKIGQWFGTAVVAGGLVALSTLSTVVSSAHTDVRPTVDRNLSIRLKQPIVVTTGTILTREWAESHGCAGFLKKPVEEKQLLAELKHVLPTSA